MKVLIWFLCIAVYALIITALAWCGIVLGGIPTIILAWLTYRVAGFLCKKWDGLDDDISKK